MERKERWSLLTLYSNCTCLQQQHLWRKLWRKKKEKDFSDVAFKLSLLEHLWRQSRMKKRKKERKRKKEEVCHDVVLELTLFASTAFVTSVMDGRRKKRNKRSSLTLYSNCPCLQQQRLWRQSWRKKEIKGFYWICIRTVLAWTLVTSVMDNNNNNNKKEKEKIFTDVEFELSLLAATTLVTSARGLAGRSSLMPPTWSTRTHWPAGVSKSRSYQAVIQIWSKEAGRWAWRSEWVAYKCYEKLLLLLISFV